MALVNSITELFELRGWLNTVYCNLAKPLLLLCNHYSAVCVHFAANFQMQLLCKYLEALPENWDSVSHGMGTLSSMDWFTCIAHIQMKMKEGVHK